MLQAFIIVLREGFEAFLIVAIILAYLRKTDRKWLTTAVYWAIAASVAASVGLGYVLTNGINHTLVRRTLGKTIAFYVNSFFDNEALREGILGVVAIVMVVTLVIHMWRTGGQLKKRMEERLGDVSTRTSRLVAFAGVFLFTLLMITREGMETALLLIQVHTTQMVSGALIGLTAAAGMAWLWARYGHLINLKRFFQVTAVYLLLFMAQVAIYSFHEFSEAGLLPNSEALHAATEPFSPDGLYGKWFSLLAITACALWLLTARITDRVKVSNESLAEG